ncbi:MAG: hypothetical protein JOZ69_20295 [Myxococcales bacterium]|nr:hypothetical protein [Myxococcales bacterium]
MPRSGSAFALAAGPRATFEWALTGSIALRVLGEVSLNLVRPALALDGALWQLPSFSGAAGAGLAYQFP